MVCTGEQSTTQRTAHVHSAVGSFPGRSYHVPLWSVWCRFTFRSEFLLADYLDLSCASNVSFRLAQRLLFSAVVARQFQVHDTPHLDYPRAFRRFLVHWTPHLILMCLPCSPSRANGNVPPLSRCFRTSSPSIEHWYLTNFGSTLL